MKRLKILMLTAIVAVSMFGCSSDSSANKTEVENNDVQNKNQYSLLSKEDPINLTLWHYYAGSAQQTLDKIADEFNKTIGVDYGVTIQTVSKPSIGDLEIELSASAQGVVYADTMPSMFLAYGDKILELQELDVISDMNNFFSEEDKSLLIKDFMVSGVINDEQVMLPVVKSTEVMYINQTNWDDFASQNGFKNSDLETWEGVLEVSRAYYDYTDAQTPDISNDGKAFFGMDSINNFISVSSYQMGTDIFDVKNAKANIDEEALREVFDFYMEAWSMGYLDSVAKYRTDDIRSGDILAFVGSSAGFVYMPDWIEVDGQKQDIEWNSLQYPYFKDQTPYIVSQGAGIAVSKISDKQQQASALFLNFFWEDNITFALDSAYVPVTTEFLNKTEEEKMEIYTERGLQPNEINTYELVFDQIEGNRLYQPMPFEGSYTIRTELGKVFEQTATNVREIAREKIAKGMSRSQALEAVNLQEHFENMINTFYETLDSKGISR